MAIDNMHVLGASRPAHQALKTALEQANGRLGMTVPIQASVLYDLLGEAGSDEELRARRRHEVLHRALDELFACFISENPDRRGYLDATLQELIEWSHAMATKRATCADKAKHGDPPNG